MSSNKFVSDKNGAIIDQLASTMAELVEQSDILLNEMKKIKEQDKELEDKEKTYFPKYEKFLGSKHEEFKRSKVIPIDDIKEFITAKNELDSIREKRLELEEKAKEINEKRSILTSQVEEAYEKIVDLIKDSNDEMNKERGIYVKTLGCHVDIVDTYVRDDREVVDSSLSEIIRTTSRIYDALYQGYSEHVTTIETEPTEKYSETKSLIGSLDELIKAQNIKIDSQIPLLNAPQKQVLTEEKPTLVSEPTIEKPVELSVDNALVKQPETPEQEPTENKENFIKLESIMNGENQPAVSEQVEEKSIDGKVITINTPYHLNSSDKIANSNTNKYENIVKNFKKIAPLIVLDIIKQNTIETPQTEVNTNQVVQQSTDPIANFLSNSQAA